MYFDSIFTQTVSASQIKQDCYEVNNSVQNLLDDMGLAEYYPQKLSYGDVIKLTEDALKDVNEKPSALRELPWYFMRRLIGLNSNIREKGSVVGRNSTTENRIGEFEHNDIEEECSFTWSSEEGDTEDEELRHPGTDDDTIANCVHPLDLIYIIFLCADDFLRQELADKLSKCQYAVPFILPSPARNEGESQNTILRWGLQTISRTYCEENGPVMTKNLLNICCPVISCLSLNTGTTWKSRLLNKMLSPQQDTFWHEGLEGGNRSQKVSQGMLEVSWYLPAGRGNDEFKTPVTFINLRGEANQHPLVAEHLTNLSTTTCIFTDRINKEVVTFLGKHFGKKNLSRMILIDLYNPADEKKHLKDIKKLKQKLHSNENQIISCPLEDSNFHTTYDILKKSLQISMEENILRHTSLHKFTEEVKSSGCMIVDDVACSNGYNAAQRILSDIAGTDSDNVKSQILPCQSDVATREEIGKHDKEICRQKEIAESVLMTQHVHREEDEKWQLQWKQLRYPISDTFTHFLRYITNFDSFNRKCFLQSLKLGLNERSVELLQPLYEDYEKYRLEERSKETDRKLKELNEQLTYNSFGLEHFFREIAVMYENMAALIEKVDSKENQLEAVLDTVSKTMADILLEGEAIEILDGDVVHSPVLWLKAVLSQIENKEKLRIFKVSALGAQSSGKSTLLNTVFGLNFPVTSGRCTRGAYMQFVKIDKPLANRLHCDYLLVIDSEGLMSRVAKNDDYDNELATFVIGLSDLTLVVIKGEGNEMQDVLPIAIHVFLRMNVLGELQACHFVHQNMGAVDVKKLMPIEIDTFVQLLDEKTRAAAQEAWKKKYTQFTDVLHYDKNKDNTYVCGLWDGTPPMGKTDIEYSNMMQRLKCNILERLETVSRKKHCSTLEDFSKWLEVIWEAVKYENFVFSFRNVLAVEAYKSLSRILNDKQWEIKKTMREKMEEKKREIKDKLMTEKDNNKIIKTIENITDKAVENITDSIQRLLDCIRHYFQCPGCQEKDCCEEVRNRQFLRDYKGEFEHDIWRFLKTLEEEIRQTAKSILVELSSHQDSAMMDGLLKPKVQEAIVRASTESFSEKDKEKIFEAMWKSETEEIIRNIPQKGKSLTFIKTTVEKAIKDSLGSEYFMYNRKKADFSHQFQEARFNVKQGHINGSHSLDRIRILFHLSVVTDEIVKETAAHYRRVQQGKEFEPKHAETLFKDIQKEIDRIKEIGIETTLDYRVDFMMYIEELAVRNFNLNQRAYEENVCPSTLLKIKKDAYRSVFLIETGPGNPAVGFGTIMLKIIEENVEDQLTCTKLLSILRTHQGGVFRGVQALITSSITNLVNPNISLRLSIEKFDKMIKDTITKESITCLGEGYLLINSAISKVNNIEEYLIHLVQRTVQSNCTNKDFIGTLFSNMKGLKKPHNDIEAYKMVTVENKSTFAGILISQLVSYIRRQLEANIESWNVAKIIEKKRLTEFVFEEIVGCLICRVRKLHHFYFNHRRFRYQISLNIDEESAKLHRTTHNCNEPVDSGTEIIIQTGNIFSGQKSQGKYNTHRFPRRRREKSFSKT